MTRLAFVLLVACGGSSKGVGGAKPGDLEPGGGGAPDAGVGSHVCKDVDSDPFGSCSKEGGGGPAVLTDGELEVVGAIPKDSIHRVVRENFTAIRYCYEALLMQNPTIEGRVVARFKVGLDGTVSDATATGVHPDLETCVAEKIRKFRFPRPDGGGAVEVTYPLTFKPG
ncbi:MAG: energy transducer TonB [Deltaproteobacteria bacterium]|nr:energy transducer TonB [Deltaproteobacteria bacterium]